jgi:hypothetical protein
MSERWLKHIRKLAAHNADLRIEIRSLRLQLTAMEDEVNHCRTELSRQNARILTMMIQKEVDNA